ncbi:hypothetical protein K1719_034061 [Acacia pycnantha]|nr:hypothetical protein K1719_034061 [Acacia pycnantha]
MNQVGWETTDGMLIAAILQPRPRESGTNHLLELLRQQKGQAPKKSLRKVRSIPVVTFSPGKGLNEGPPFPLHYHTAAYHHS